MTENTTSRRGALKKVGVGTAAAGIAWSAPRVDGLTLRPQYAGAQTGPGDIDAPGGSFDLAFLIDAPGDPGISSTDTASIPGISAAIGGLGAFDVPPFPLEACVEMSGPAASINCFVTGIDVPSAGLGDSFFSLGSPGVAHGGCRPVNDPGAGPPWTVTGHILCT